MIEKEKEWYVHSCKLTAPFGVWVFKPDVSLATL